MQDDKVDLMLLRCDPVKLLLKYQTTFKLIARRYAQMGYYPFEDCEEVLQHMNARLFSRIDTLFDQYDGRVLVRTYLSAICRNSIKEQVRAVRRRNQVLRDPQVMEPPFQLPVTSQMLIREELRRFGKILMLYGKKRHRLLLLMKLIYRIRISRTDLDHFGVNTGTLLSDGEIHRLNTDIDLKDKEIYRIIFPVFEKTGANISHPDSLRKWFNHKTREVIGMLNAPPAKAAYMEDTLQILVEKYCALIEDGLNEGCL